MKRLLTQIKIFFDDEEGLTIVEYVVGAGLLVIALGAFFINYATILSGKFERVIS